MRYWIVFDVEEMAWTTASVDATMLREIHSGPVQLGAVDVGEAGFERLRLLAIVVSRGPANSRTGMVRLTTETRGEVISRAEDGLFRADKAAPRERWRSKEIGASVG